MDLILGGGGHERFRVQCRAHGEAERHERGNCRCRCRAGRRCAGRPGWVEQQPGFPGGWPARDSEVEGDDGPVEEHCEGEEEPDDDGRVDLIHRGGGVHERFRVQRRAHGEAEADERGKWSCCRCRGGRYRRCSGGRGWVEQRRGTPGGGWPAREEEVEREDGQVEESRYGDRDAGHNARLEMQFGGGGERLRVEQRREAEAERDEKGQRGSRHGSGRRVSGFPSWAERECHLGSSFGFPASEEEEELGVGDSATSGPLGCPAYNEAEGRVERECGHF